MDEYNKPGNVGLNQSVKPEPSAGAGSIIGAVIIILLLAAGAFYFWGSMSDGGDNNPPPLILGDEATGTGVPSDTASGLPPQQASDETAAINADIQAMNIDQLNAQTASSLTAYQAATE